MTLVGRNDSLLRRLSVEVLVVGFRVCARMVDGAVAMIRRRIERVELQRDAAGIDDVVICPGRNDDREARPDRRAGAIENSLPGSLLDPEELVELVDFRTDLFLGLERHDDQLAVLRRVEHPTKLLVADGETLDVLHKAFHSDSSFVTSISFLTDSTPLTVKGPLSGFDSVRSSLCALTHIWPGSRSTPIKEALCKPATAVVSGSKMSLMVA